MSIDALENSVDFTSVHSPLHEKDSNHHWSRSSVIYQIYPRSFKDSNNDGIGDLPGVTQELHKLVDLSIDAVWLSPFYKSPQKDGGYDVSDYCAVDPIFGEMGDFDNLMIEANKLEIKVIIDLVPNHCSDQHEMFQQAIAAEAGSAEREMFIFRDGQGDNGELPPNNWQSHFGGGAWTRLYDAEGRGEQWYLHLFDTSQPDWNWDNPLVRSEFERVLRFWLDKGVSGFRVDVAHALVKAEGLPDWGGLANGNSSDGFPGVDAPMFGQEEVHDIYRRWREILAEYGDDRILCAEANVDPLERLSHWVRKDEMHQAFNFAYLHAPWNAHDMRSIISTSLQNFDAVDAPTTWVLSNHDVVRHATRFGRTDGDPRGGDGIGGNDSQPDLILGLERARAATLAMLGLPGGIYLYQGEELGLPDNTYIADELRQDPTFTRTQGHRIGRDGCRVPIPWTSDAETAFGFSDSPESWLPQSDTWGDLSRENQQDKNNSTLAMYQKALSLRKMKKTGSGSLTWFTENFDHSIVAFSNGDYLVVMNMGSESIKLPALPVALTSWGESEQGDLLHPNQTVWLECKQ